MDGECRSMLGKKRKAYFALARECEEIHTGAYDKLVALDRDEFFPKIVETSEFARSLHSSDASIARKEAERRWKRVMHEGGTALHWTETQVERLRRGMSVASCYDAEKASKKDLQMLRKVPSCCMCNSASKDRTWVELRESTVREYAAWLKRAERERKESKHKSEAAAPSSSAPDDQARPRKTKAAQRPNEGVNVL
jgi:hypothetical protein